MYKLPNGDIVFPNKGVAPINPNESKYQRDEHNQYLFHLKLPPCNQRITINKQIPRCQRTIRLSQCLVSKEIVDYVDCNLCPYAEEIRNGPKLPE